MVPVSMAKAPLHARSSNKITELKRFFWNSATVISVIPLLVIIGSQTAPLPPKVGDVAPSLNLHTLGKEVVNLAPLLKKGPVVLVVLRGYPGYQCPFCTRQVNELLNKSDEFAKRKASVVLVYPGPADGLAKYAGDFVSGKDIPSHFRFTLDPDYGFALRYNLRWNAPHETAFPSTFVIGTDGRVSYEKISHSHADRAPISEVLGALDKFSMKS